MKQVLRKGLKNIVVEDVPDPVLQPQHVLIRPLASLISSGTETASIKKDGVLAELRRNPTHVHKVVAAARAIGPMRTLAEVQAKFSEYAVLGYSGAGLVAAVHPTVTGVEAGQLVAFGGEGSGHAETVLAPRNLVVPVPNGVSAEQASFATLGSIALNAVRIAEINLGQTVAVIGLGIVGQLIAQLARLQGAVVIGIDLRPERVDLARHLGADYAFAGNATAGVLAATEGRGVDAVIVAAAAKSAGPCEQALHICADRGRMIIVGAVPLEFPWHEMYMKEVKLFMSRAYGPGSYDAAYEKQGHDYPIAYVRWTENRNMEEFLRLVSLGRVQLGPLVTHRFDLDDAPAAYETIMDPSAQSLAVVLRYPSARIPEALPAFTPSRRVEVRARPHGAGAIRVGLVGAGNLARWAHLPIIKKMAGVELRGVCSASGARGRGYAERFGAQYCCADYEELLRDPDIDLVFIVSRNQAHASQALDALRAGKHVFVEKPMALTVEECRLLEAEVAASGRQLTVGFNRRFAPFYRGLKDALRGRTSPAVVNCRINSPGISGAYWMADPASGGAILGEACHFVDLMPWLLDAEPVAVSAFMLPTGTSHPIGENNLVATVQFADGSIGNLTYCTVGSETSGGERVEVFADGVGASTEDFTRLDVKTSRKRRRSKIWPDKGYAELVGHFVQSLRDGAPPAITVRDGSRATVGCLLMLDSARQGGVLQAFDLDARLLEPEVEQPA